jgi:hypothetical protein
VCRVLVFEEEKRAANTSTCNSISVVLDFLEGRVDGEEGEVVRICEFIYTTLLALP